MALSVMKSRGQVSVTYRPEKIARKQTQTWDHNKTQANKKNFTKLNRYFIWQYNSLCIRLNWNEKNGSHRGIPSSVLLLRINRHNQFTGYLDATELTRTKGRVGQGLQQQIGNVTYEEPFFLPLRRPLRLTFTGIRSLLSTGVRFMQNLERIR